MAVTSSSTLGLSATALAVTAAAASGGRIGCSDLHLLPRHCHHFEQHRRTAMALPQLLTAIPGPPDAHTHSAVMQQPLLPFSACVTRPLERWWSASPPTCTPAPPRRL